MGFSIYINLYIRLLLYSEKSILTADAFFRLFILATLTIIIVATFYENILIQRGYDFSGGKIKAKKDTEHEMNHFNNNNNDNECEVYRKIHQESDSQKLGELLNNEISFPFH